MNGVAMNISRHERIAAASSHGYSLLLIRQFRHASEALEHEIKLQMRLSLRERAATERRALRHLIAHRLCKACIAATFEVKTVVSTKIANKVTGNARKGES